MARLCDRVWHGVAPAGCLIVLLVLLGAALGQAAAPSLQLRLNGQPLALEAPCETRSGQLMAPMQGLFRALGVVANYDHFTRTIKAWKGTTVVLMQLDSPLATVNLKSTRLPVAPYTSGASIMIPLRFSCEAFGARVWTDGGQGIVDLRTDGRSGPLARLPHPGQRPSPSASPSTRPAPSPSPGSSPVPPASPSPSPMPSASPGGPVVIQEFRHGATGRLRPGDVLTVTMVGTAGGRATFFVEGLVEDQLMRETTPGHYGGEVRIAENVKARSCRVFGTLQVGAEKAPLAVAAAPVVIEPLRPRLDKPEPAAGAVVLTGTPRISALFETMGGSLDPRSVRIRVNGEDVTARAYVTQKFFSYTPEVALPAGAVRVEVEAPMPGREPLKDTWDFIVRAVTPPSRPPTSSTADLSVTAPRAGDLVMPEFHVRGDATAGALVTVVVSTRLPVAERDVEVTRGQALADAQGRFDVPVRLVASVQGMSYRLHVTAQVGGRSAPPVDILVVGK